MITPTLPYNEPERLKALGKYNLLDTLPEEDFDRITYLASVICQTPISLISLVDKDRQFFISHLGIDVNETHKDLSFCAHAINQPEILFEVEDARLDERFHDNPFVTGKPNIVFYAGIPLVDTDGFALGTLCVVDRKPRKLTNEQKESLTKLSKQVMITIEARQKKKIEDELKLVNYTFRNASVPIYYVLEDASIYDFNDIGCENLGYTRDELKALKIYDLDTDYDERKWASVWAKLKTKKKITVETKQKKKDGALLDVIITANFVKYGDLELNCSYVLDVTEKKKQEQQMAIVDFAFRNSTTPINILNKDASIFDFNEAAHQLLGYTKEEYKEISIPDIDPDYQYNIWPIHWEELKKTKSLSFETKLKKKNGEIINANIEANFIQYGNLELNCVFFTDITEKKKQEEQLQLLDYSYKHTDSAMFFLDEYGSYFDFNQATANMLGYSYEEFRGKTVIDVNPMVTKEYWAKRWEELKVIPNQNFEAKLKRKDGVFIDVAVSTNSIELNGKIVNFGFYEDITEKKKLEENLNLSAFTIDNAAWGVVYFKKDGTIYNCNQAFAKIFGYTSLEEVKTKTVFDFGNAYTTESWKLYWESLRENKRLQFVAKRTKADGTILDVEINPNIIQFGSLELNCGFVYDVTEKIALDKSLKIVDFSFRNATIAMHFWRKDGYMFDSNEASRKLLGYTTEEYKKLNIVEVSNRHTVDTWPKRFEELKKGPNKPYITTLRRKDQTWVYVEIRSEIIVYEDVELCFSSIIDVTEKLKAEENLNRSNQRYEFATLATSDVIWEVDLLKKESFISKNFTTFFGHPVGDGWMPMGNDIWMQNINPDDFDTILEKRSAVLNCKESNNIWIGEYRLRKADGSYATVKDKTFAIKDENGNIVRMVGAMQDITKQRMEEERLRLMESVILNTNDAILITEAEPYDLPGPRILFVNKAFTEMTGYLAEEVIGKTPRILQNEDTDRKELDKIRYALEKWEPCEVNLLNSTKNGEKFWVNLRITPLANEKGWYTHWISIQRDVTLQKEAEKEKEKLINELVENNLELKQFSYITSHNLRAPLTNLVSICNIIKPGTGTDPLTLQLIEGFKTSTHHLNETLNDLIEVLIIKENRNIQKDQLTFEEIFKKTSESLAQSLQEKKVIINADFSAAPSVIFANEYLESVFLNLLTNAVKYRHPDRDPIITIKTNKEPNGDTKLTFADNGIGINMVLAKDKIFGLYKRFHNNADSKGIGLYLIHSQITTLGGKIELESEVNIGTTFTITFK